MSILLDRTNRVLIQGATGQMGTFFVEDARKYGTNIVAGVSPGREGTTKRSPATAKPCDYGPTMPRHTITWGRLSSGKTNLRKPLPVIGKPSGSDRTLLQPSAIWATR